MRLRFKLWIIDIDKEKHNVIGQIDTEKGNPVFLRAIRSRCKQSLSGFGLLAQSTDGGTWAKLRHNKVRSMIYEYKSLTSNFLADVSALKQMRQECVQQPEQPSENNIFKPRSKNRKNCFRVAKKLLPHTRRCIAA
jgi:hypothetical protein